MSTATLHRPAAASKPLVSSDALGDLAVAIASFRRARHAMTTHDRERAMALLLKEADDLLRSGLAGVVGRGDAMKWCQELADEAAGLVGRRG